jgi:hypothetical protein
MSQGELQLNLRLCLRCPLFPFQNYDIKQPKKNAAAYFFTQTFPVTMPLKFAFTRPGIPEVRRKKGAGHGFAFQGDVADENATLYVPSQRAGVSHWR